MSTTEDQAASNDWHRAQPPRVATRGKLEFNRTHVWTDDTGLTYALISFGAVDFTFLNPQHIRDTIARLAALAGEMDAEVQRQQPAERGCVRDGHAAAACGNPDHKPEPPVCARCGASGVPMVTQHDGPRCYNAERCAERVAARDAADVLTPAPKARALLGQLVERSDDDAPVPIVGEIVGLDGTDDDGQVEYVKVAWGYPDHGNDDGSVSPVTEAMDELRPARTGVR